MGAVKLPEDMSIITMERIFASYAARTPW